MGIVAFKPIRDVEIMGLVQNGSYKDNGGGGIIDYYYTVLPGFTADEFIQYVEKLKKGKDSRPFSSYPAILHIPFCNNIRSIQNKKLKPQLRLLQKMV